MMLESKGILSHDTSIKTKKDLCFENRFRSFMQRAIKKGAANKKHRREIPNESLVRLYEYVRFNT